MNPGSVPTVAAKRFAVCLARYRGNGDRLLNVRNRRVAVIFVGADNRMGGKR